MLRFARNDVETCVPVIATRFRPSLYNLVAPLLWKGRRESRALTAPVAPCAMVERNAHGLDRYSRDIPAFPAQWLYDLLRALPGERRFLSPLPSQHGPEWIDATVAAPGPHDFAVRCLRSRPALFTPDASCVHRIPCPTFRDDREAPLRRARGVDKLLPICVIVKYISD